MESRFLLMRRRGLRLLNGGAQNLSPQQRHQRLFRKMSIKCSSWCLAAAVTEARLAQASKYNIVVGSFITPEYARAWEQEYRTRGFDPKIVQMEGGRFELVVAESYETLGKAASRLNQIQESVQVDAWIYKKK